MKPLKLTLQGFGSYVDKNVIDFTKLGDNRLFLITGSTGGGKTTILDGMCFALYCRATGGMRSWDQMRSIGIDDSVPTTLEFEFSSAGAVYKFCRSRKMYLSRDKSEQKAKDEHACYKLDESGAWQLIQSGVESKVSECAYNILGLDCEQFSKIIVLPQGEFRKLLLSSSKEKAAIFEKLFSTEKWTAITERLKKETSRYSDDLDRLTIARKTVLESENVASLDELNGKVEQNGELLAVQQRLVSEYADKMDKLTLLINRITQIDAVNSQLSVEKRREAELSDKKNNYDINFRHLEVQYNGGKILRNEIARLNEKITLLKAKLQDCEKLEELKEKINNFDEDKLAAEKSQKTAEKILEDSKTLFANTEKNIAEMQHKIDGIPALMQKLHTLQGINETYEKLEKAKQRFEIAANNVEAKKKLYDNQTIGLEALQNEKRRIEREKMKDMSVTLAGILQENMPCPVCGSTEHPAPADKLSEESAELEEKLKKIIELIEEDGNKAAFLLKDYTTAIAEKDSIEREMTDLQALCNTYNIYYKTIVDDISALNNELADLNKLKTRLDNTKTDLERIKKSVSANEVRAKQAAQAVIDKDIERERILSAIHELSEKMPEDGTSAHDITMTLNNLTDKNNRLTKQLNDIEFKYNEEKKQYAVVTAMYEENQGNISRLTARYKELAEGIPTEALDKLEELKDKYTECKAMYEDILTKTAALKSAQEASLKAKEKLDLFEDKYLQADKSYRTSAHLSELFSGRNPLKVPIKIFVLSIMLDSIIMQANGYFATLSGNRYILSRVTDKTRGNAMGGLDIEIYDAFYGKYRAIYTLSGGELFLASLSLAFGLADVVQAHAGGVHLDSIFIDEGFGSLDKETLDTAMRALNSIKDMGRLVGIISHVSELKSMIEAKIIVEAGKNGSNLYIDA